MTKTNYREPPTKLLLLDLDGTIRRTKDGSKFINNPANQELIPGVLERLEQYNLASWIILGVTNQAGVEAEHISLEECISGLRITLNNIPQMYKIYFSTDLAGKQVGHVLRNGGGLIDTAKKLQEARIHIEFDSFRKPGMGMYQLIYQEYEVPPEHVVMVGDYKTDEEFANNINAKFIWADKWLAGEDYLNEPE